MKTILKYFFFIICITICLAIGSFFYIVNNHVIDLSPLAHYNPGKPSILLDDQGEEWGRFSLDRRQPISLSEMPQHVINAFIAAEDWQFFAHGGISWKGIIRSTLINAYNRRIVQGASTITQQLVKLLFLDCQRTFTRKIKEQMYSLLVEQQFTKEYILETYLNHIYFGCGIYGVQAASQRFWGKNVADLTIAQSAVLASIVRSPNHYCPLLSTTAVQKRRDLVLYSMLKLRFITQDEYAHACEQPVEVITQELHTCAPYVKETIRLFIENIVGKEKLYKGGLIIQTTINRDIQLKAQESFTTHVAQLKKNLMPEVDGALITLENTSGQIKALVGGYDYMASQFNRVFQAKRQMGSVFKPLVYASALAKGIPLFHTEFDEPFQLVQPGGIWQPNNYNKRFEGQMTLARALSRSNNIVTIKTLLKMGAQESVQLGYRCKLTGPLYPYPSLALGCADATLHEVARMFSIFVNHGVYKEPYMISWIKDSWGTKLWRVHTESQKVIDSKIADQIAQVLQLSIERWRTVFNRPICDSAVISKTGTTNDSRTCWYAGSTPELTTVIYVGCDDNRSLGPNVFPVRTAFPIWEGLHGKISTTQKKFIYDSSLQEVYIHEYTGERVSSGHPNAIKILI